MTLNLAALRATAEAATPGPWEFDGYQMVSLAEGLNFGSRIILDVEEGHVYSEYSSDSATLDVTPQNAAFIAAANPATVLELLTELQSAREALRVAEEGIAAFADTVPDFFDDGYQDADPVSLESVHGDLDLTLVVRDFRRAASAIATIRSARE